MDKEIPSGNILAGEKDVSGKVRFEIDTFGGKNEDIVYFTNIYKNGELSQENGLIF